MYFLVGLGGNNSSNITAKSQFLGQSQLGF
jgi:hypothetical protein